ncbi:MAG: TSCPD domain-containing protein, partial [Alistipes sp.]|nr:TSCPD domain-containing protein [Alistipes sp.]
MIEKIIYPCEGTCSQQIEIELEDGIIRRAAFLGGCHGNT